MSNSIIVNYAILETMQVNSPEGYIDHFIPFIAEILFESKDESMPVDELITKLNKQFSIPINDYFINRIINKSKKLGYLSRKDGLLWKKHDKVSAEAITFQIKRNEVVRQQNLLSDRLVLFAKEKHSIDLSNNDCLNCLENYFKGHSPEILSSIYDIESLAVIEKEKHSLKNYEYLISEFVLHNQKREPETFEILLTVFKGYLLASYITYSEIAESTTHFKETTFYIDTPILMGLLGFNGIKLEKIYKELIKTIKDVQAKICIFKDTVLETKHVILAYARDLGSKSYNNFKEETLNLLLSKGFDEVALTNVANMIDFKIENLEIEIVNRPKYDKNFQIDETSLIDKTKVNFKNRSEKHDIDCAAAIYRLRKGVAFQTLKKTSIFVTTSSSLIKSVNNYLKDYSVNNKVPYIVSPAWVSNMLWALNPNVFSNLPKNIIIANSYACINHDGKFWHNVISRLDRLKTQGKITQEEYSLVRYDYAFKQRAKEMSVTHDEIDDTDLLTLAEETKLKIIAKEKVINEELKKQMEFGVITSLKEINDKNQKIIKMDNTISVYENNINKFCGLFAKLVSKTFFIFLVILLIYFLYKQAFSPNTVNITIVIILTVLNTVFGFTFKMVYDYLYKWTFNKLKKHLCNSENGKKLTENKT